MIFFISLLLLGGCSGESYKTISAAKANEMIGSNKVTVIDVRTSAEFLAGHIPNATLIPLDKIEKSQSELDKNKEYIIVCSAGSRSAKASTLLAEKGFKHIYNLSGGMHKWTGEVVKEN